MATYYNFEHLLKINAQSVKLAVSYSNRSAVEVFDRERQVKICRNGRETVLNTNVTVQTFADPSLEALDEEYRRCLKLNIDISRFSDCGVTTNMANMTKIKRNAIDRDYATQKELDFSTADMSIGATWLPRKRQRMNNDVFLPSAVVIDPASTMDGKEQLLIAQRQVSYQILSALEDVPHGAQVQFPSPRRRANGELASNRYKILTYIKQGNLARDLVTSRMVHIAPLVVAQASSSTYVLGPLTPIKEEPEPADEPPLPAMTLHDLHGSNHSYQQEEEQFSDTLYEEDDVDDEAQYSEEVAKLPQRPEIPWKPWNIVMHDESAYYRCYIVNEQLRRVQEMLYSVVPPPRPVPPNLEQELKRVPIHMRYLPQYESKLRYVQNIDMSESEVPHIFSVSKSKTQQRLPQHEIKLQNEILHHQNPDAKSLIPVKEVWNAENEQTSANQCPGGQLSPTSPVLALQPVKKSQRRPQPMTSVKCSRSTLFVKKSSKVDRLEGRKRSYENDDTRHENPSNSDNDTAKDINNCRRSVAKRVKSNSYHPLNPSPGLR